MARSTALCAALLLVAVLAHAGHDDHDHDHDHGDDTDFAVGADGEVAGGYADDDGHLADDDYADDDYDDEDYAAGGGRYDDDGGADDEYYGGGDGDSDGDDFVDPSLLADFDKSMKDKLNSMENPYMGDGGGGGMPDFGDLEGMLGGANDLEDLPDFEQAMAEELQGAEGGSSGGGGGGGGVPRVKSPLPIGLDCAELTAPTMKKETELVRARGGVRAASGRVGGGWHRVVGNATRRTAPVRTPARALLHAHRVPITSQYVMSRHPPPPPPCPLRR